MKTSRVTTQSCPAGAWHRFLPLATALWGIAACSGGEAAKGTPPRHAPPVEAVQARSGALPLSQRLSGVVRARNQVEITPRINAVITEVLVENGAAVAKGQPLVRLRDTEFQQRLKQAAADQQIAQAQLRRARAQAREARSELDRVESLTQKELASAVDLETARVRTEAADADVELALARLEQAEATAAEQEENLSQTVIRAPIAGHVGNRGAEVGMLANPNTRLFTLGQLDSVRVQVILTDRMLVSIAEGHRATVSAGGMTATSAISRISPFLHPVTHSTEAEIDLANPEGHLKSGMFVTVDVFYGESEEATLVPLSALYEQPATGSVGVFTTSASLDPDSIDELGTPQAMSLTGPIAFRFTPTPVIAQGRMEAAIRGVDPGTWVVTLGQNLLGEESAEAMVRPVRWERVERLQKLQREDLMREVIEHQPPGDTP